MAQVGSNPLRHSDLYNRVQDWITGSDAAHNSHEPRDKSSLRHPPSFYLQPVSYAFDKDRYEEIKKMTAEPENMPASFAEQQPGWLGWEDHFAERGGATVCYPSVRKLQQARVGQVASLESTGSQQPVASSTANNLTTSSKSEERRRHGYERQPRHRTKTERYEYKVQDKKISERPRSKKRTFNDTFHAPNVPCDRLTLSQKRTSGIFKRGKASSPIRNRSRDPSLGFFGFDTIVNTDTMRASAGSDFSENDFLTKGSTNNATQNSSFYGHLEEKCHSVSLGSRYKSDVSDTASTVALYCSRELPKADHIVTESMEMNATSELATDSYVSACGISSSRNSDVHLEERPNSHLDIQYFIDDTSIGEGQHCSTRLQDGVSQKYKHPSDVMRSNEVAGKPSVQDKAGGQNSKERGTDEVIAAARVHDNTINQSALPNASKCRQPTLEPRSRSVADTEVFDYEGVMGAKVRGSTTQNYNQLLWSPYHGGSRKMSLMSDVGICGENPQGHQSQIRQSIEEPDYESVDFTAVPEANDCCSEVASLIDLEEWETASIIVDMDTELDTQVLSMPTSSAANCNNTQEIQERLEATQFDTSIQGKKPHHLWEARLEKPSTALCSTDSMRDTPSVVKESQMRGASQLSVHDGSIESDARATYRPGPWLESLSRRRGGAIGIGIGRLDPTDGLGTFWQQRMGY
ncbi:uncharacterized protein BO88DRAFT_341310 [Aspergillus vadensis CBS 113365]|uniref:Uncharacterized protein n=1 Tax=Aspergillus vadensis (strain CBS 113365 / IMI 142717 / IBT 24658) TaxID=1448311 RepID=A0A319B9B8_ASPVC|nr:hypothetical protein BO88DRAFT_341310 [Aspergillus vadensis CBS 113365]PYH68969.1 hypothetical protein BO88DRAFT_341310 [Aspergillus vadensis CBS 113365]